MFIIGFRAISNQKWSFKFFYRRIFSHCFVNDTIHTKGKTRTDSWLFSDVSAKDGSDINISKYRNVFSVILHRQFCVSPSTTEAEFSNSEPYVFENIESSGNVGGIKKSKGKKKVSKSVDFTKVHIDLLPTVIIVGRPNVGKSALFNRLIRRREALVYNTPDDHVTRDFREGIAKLGDLRFKVMDSAGLEMGSSLGSVLDRTADITASVFARSHFAIFLIDVREGLHPMDLEVGKWMRKHAPTIPTVIAMNKSESLDDVVGLLSGAAGEAYALGFGDPIAISAETGLGMADLYEALRPLLEDYMLRTLDVTGGEEERSEVVLDEESNLPLQLAIVGKPNVGKSTLLNSILQQERVIVGPESGLTRDSIRVRFEFQGRTIFLVDTAGWLHRTKGERGPSTLSVVQSRKNLMRAQIVVLVLDAKEIADGRSSMKHVEVGIARRAVEEGRGLVVVVNKMDLLGGRRNKEIYDQVVKAVPLQIQRAIPQVSGIPVVFVSALKDRGRIAVMHEVIRAYKKWCLRLTTARLNRWLSKVMSRHSFRDEAAQPKIKYLTQVKARPPTFVVFVKGKKTKVGDSDMRFLRRSLVEDFDIGGIPIRIMQRSSDTATLHSSSPAAAHRSARRRLKRKEHDVSDKRQVSDSL